MSYFQGKVAVITGAASGIGKTLALKLAEQGCNLALADRDMEGLITVRKKIIEFDVKCLIEDFDVSDKEAFFSFAERVNSELSGVDMLFNNAGVTLIDSVKDQSFEDFHWIMNINFWGVVYGSNAFIPFLQKSPQAHLVNVSSVFGLLSLPGQSAYNSSKFAVRGFTEALKMEMAGTNISVHCVHPGGIKTNISNNAKVTSKSISKSQNIENFNKLAKTTPEEAADIILQGVEKNKRRILIGKDAKLLDRIVRWFPATYEKVLGFEKGVLASRKK